MSAPRNQTVRNRSTAIRLLSLIAMTAAAVMGNAQFVPGQSLQPLESPTGPATASPRVASPLMVGNQVPHQTTSRPRINEDSAPYQLDSWIIVDAAARTGTVVVRATLQDGGYIHSLTQEGPAATKIELALNDGFSIDGIFRPTKEPEVIERDPVLGERVEKHYQSVDFYLPIRFASNQNPEDVSIKIRVSGQVCIDNSSCIPIRDKILIAEFSNYMLSEDADTYPIVAARLSEPELKKLERSAIVPNGSQRRQADDGVNTPSSELATPPTGQTPNGHSSRKQR